MGRNFGIWRRQGQGNPLHAEKLRTVDPGLSLGVSGLLQNLLQGPHFLCFFQEQLHRFFEIPHGLVLGAATGGDIEFQGVGYENAAFFENEGGELDFHILGITERLNHGGARRFLLSAALLDVRWDVPAHELANATYQFIDAFTQLIDTFT